MNTPEPFDSCQNLYYDAMSKDMVDGYIDCKEGLEIGNKDCKKYKKYDNSSHI